MTVWQAQSECGSCRTESTEKHAVLLLLCFFLLPQHSLLLPPLTPRPLFAMTPCDVLQRLLHLRRSPLQIPFARVNLLSSRLAARSIRLSHLQRQQRRCWSFARSILQVMEQRCPGSATRSTRSTFPFTLFHLCYLSRHFPPPTQRTFPSSSAYTKCHVSTRWLAIQP